MPGSDSRRDFFLCLPVRAPSISPSKERRAARGPLSFCACVRPTGRSCKPPSSMPRPSSRIATFQGADRLEAIRDRQVYSSPPFRFSDRAKHFSFWPSPGGGLYVWDESPPDTVRLYHLDSLGRREMLLERAKITHPADCIPGRTDTLTCWFGTSRPIHGSIRKDDSLVVSRFIGNKAIYRERRSAWDGRETPLVAAATPAGIEFLFTVPDSLSTAPPYTQYLRTRLLDAQGTLGPPSPLIRKPANLFNERPLGLYRDDHLFVVPFSEEGRFGLMRVDPQLQWVPLGPLFAWPKNFEWNWYSPRIARMDAVGNLFFATVLDPVAPSGDMEWAALFSPGGGASSLRHKTRDRARDGSARIPFRTAHSLRTPLFYKPLNARGSRKADGKEEKTFGRRDPFSEESRTRDTRGRVRAE